MAIGPYVKKTWNNEFITDPDLQNIEDQLERVSNEGVQTPSNGDFTIDTGSGIIDLLTTALRLQNGAWVGLDNTTFTPRIEFTDAGELIEEVSQVIKESDHGDQPELFSS